jgi:hypothetical protein
MLVISGDMLTFSFLILKAKLLKHEDTIKKRFLIFCLRAFVLIFSLCPLW